MAKYPEMTWGTMEAVVNKLGGMDGVERFLADEVVITPVSKPSLLEHVGTVTIPAQPRFVAREKFTKSRFWLGGNFMKWFLSKTEEPTPETTLRYARLKKVSSDKSIRTELGDTAETTLAQIYALVELQPKGESGALLVDGYANIFYVCDAEGVLRAVRVDRRSGGWHLILDSVKGPYRYCDKDQVFSRNPSTALGTSPSAA